MNSDCIFERFAIHIYFTFISWVFFLYHGIWYSINHKFCHHSSPPTYIQFLHMRNCLIAQHHSRWCIERKALIGNSYILFVGCKCCFQLNVVQHRIHFTKIQIYYRIEELYVWIILKILKVLISVLNWKKKIDCDFCFVSIQKNLQNSDFKFQKKKIIIQFYAKKKRFIINLHCYCAFDII